MLNNPHEDHTESSDDEARSRQNEMREQMVAGLTISLINKRKKAIEWRQQLGIEQEWLDAEDSYEGIDDANRAEEQPGSARNIRHRGAITGGQVRSVYRGNTRSTVFLNITGPYVDAASARVADMLLPSDDRNFSFQPSPIPDLDDDQMEMFTPEVQQALNVASEAELIKLQTRIATDSAEKAQKRVEDWLVECQYHAEVRNVIEDCARLGTGIIKGPVPAKKKYSKVSVCDDDTIAMEIDEKVSPESVWVDPWDLFPDPACGENIHNGSFLFEKDRLSAKQLRGLKGQPGYEAFDQVIDEILLEGPSRVNLTTDTDRTTQDDDRFDCWYFHGEISKDDFDAVNMHSGESAEEHVFVVCTIVNDKIIKTAKSHLDSGEFPYDLMPWKRRVGMPFGIGIAKQISVPQRMLNAATRGMNDNAGLSSGPQIVIKQGVVTPADGVYEITPRKLWHCDADADAGEVKMAFMAIDIPTRQPELMSIIEFSLKMAEEVTGMPMLMQGSQGSAPDTVGGMEILNNNSNSILRRIARLFDDRITEPHMRRYYEWIMLYGEEEEKGDFTIDARGSTSLVDRDIQRQAILSMGAVVTDPQFKLDPELWAEEMLKANKLDPKRVKMTDEKQEAQQQQQQQQQQQMQEIQQRMVEMESQLAKYKIDTEAEVDLEKINADVETANEDRQLEEAKVVAELEIKQQFGSGI